MAVAASPSAPGMQSQPSSANYGDSSEDLKNRVRAQLKHYAPEKASQADALLGKYVGKEMALLDALVKQYGPEPPASSASG